MRLNPLGRTDLRVSQFALGTMNFGSDWHGSGAVDEKTARELVAVALDLGVNLIDTADIYGYGAAERLLGKILGRRRKNVLLATKLLGRMRPDEPSSGGLSRRRVAEALDESLERLKTDYVDLYMPHGWDPQTPLDETLEALERAVEAGKVRALGCSNFSGPQLSQALASSKRRGGPRLEFDQVQYSLASRFIENDLVPVCRSEEVSILAWSPLGGGLLSGRYRGAERADGRWRDPAKAFPPLPEARLGGLLDMLRQVAVLEGQGQAQLAASWTAGRPGVASAIVGARSPAQLEATLTARPLTDLARKYLDAASDVCAVR